jgi:hypothetical protein
VESEGCLVAPAVFKTVAPDHLRWVGSIPTLSASLLVSISFKKRTSPITDSRTPDIGLNVCRNLQAFC